MFSKLVNPGWILYSNCERIDYIEVRQTYSLHIPWVVIVCFASGVEKEVFSGDRDECEEFANSLLGNILGMQWRPKGDSAPNATLGL